MKKTKNDAILICYSNLKLYTELSSHGNRLRMVWIRHNLKDNNKL